ncbi:transposase [Cupriavidus metallidurans]|jgi:transposase|uniref:Transposase IS204/IS1001/IS1096/IS1165 DDE domain-containing protein n=1 Tax=Cupriavidus metallidurans (strain ATCC 43123 / DSM 2839 / NBRC 102507 / CH34) TaxID=266264 RepID=Q1LMT8_CUPMC|nr:hypothetical protein Rmet_1655 [Cupriavidus metallidurans CH34]
MALFGQRLQTYWHGTLARCGHPLNTSVVEGINNTIRVIKRRAYGYPVIRSSTTCGWTTSG